MGKYSQVGTGTLNIELGRTAAGSQFDQIIANGSATLDGMLSVSPINSFSPVVGNAFQVLLFGSRSGQFATLIGLNLGSGRVLDPFFNLTNFMLTVA